jgi:hypothetical protein
MSIATWKSRKTILGQIAFPHETCLCHCLSIWGVPLPFWGEGAQDTLGEVMVGSAW